MCDGGFSGTIAAISSSPYFSGGCEPVPCPHGSSGSSVPAGCRCAGGLQGGITPAVAEPFYAGECGCVPISAVLDGLEERSAQAFFLSVDSSAAISLRVRATRPSACGALEYAWLVHESSLGTAFAIHAPSSTTATLHIPYGAVPENTSVAVTVRVSSRRGCSSCNTSMPVATISRGLDPLTVYISGGDFRTVGRDSDIALVAVTSIDSSALHFSWSCFDDLGAQVAVMEASGQSAWTTPAAPLPGGALYVCTVAVQSGSAPHDGRNATASTSVRIEEGNPPSVLITTLGREGKFDTTQMLRLVGEVMTAVETEVQLQWTVSRYTASASIAADVEASTSFSGPNLVLQPHQLVPGATYSFRLTATTAAGTGEGRISVVANAAPSGGQIHCTPPSGMAVRDSFSLSAPAWHDDDLPLTYRFGSSSRADSAAVTYLSDFSLSDSVDAILPAGHSDRNHTVVLHVEVRDGWGAMQTANTTNTTVVPFEVPAGASLSGAVEGILSAQAGDLQSVGQAVSSIAAALNEAADSGSSGAPLNNSEATKTRDLLVFAIFSSATAVTETAAVTRVGEMLSAVTSNPEQLSSESTDKALGMAMALATTTARTGGTSAVVDSQALESVAKLMSNLVVACASQFASSAKLDSSDARNAQESSVLMTEVIDSLSSTLVSDMLAGEAEKTMATDSFAMRVQVDTPDAFGGKLIGGGKVHVPVGAFDSVGHDRTLSAKVVEWADAGPLFYAAALPPAGDNSSSLASPLLSVDFTAGRTPVNVSGLLSPFILTLEVRNANNINVSATCGYWNTSALQWVTDGKLLAATDTNITCAFPHLTSFAAFTGPSNVSPCGHCSSVAITIATC